MIGESEDLDIAEQDLTETTVDPTVSATDNSSSSTQMTRQKIPVLVVVNRFMAITKFESQHVLPLAVSWIQRARAHFRSPYFSGDDENEACVFQFLPPTTIDVCKRHHVQRLIAPLLASIKSIQHQSYPLPGLASYMLRYFEWSKLPKITSYEVMEDALMKYVATLPWSSTVTQRNERFGRALVRYAVRIIEQRMGRILTIRIPLRLTTISSPDAGGGAFGNAKITSEYVVTDPAWFSSAVLGEVFDRMAKLRYQSPVRPKIMVTRSELDALLPEIASLLPPELSISAMLEALKIAIPPSATASIDSSMFCILGLIEEKMPPVDDLYHQRLLRPVSEFSRTLVRAFALRDQRCTFFPGFFTRLFTFIHDIFPHQLSSHFWADGMFLEANTSSPAACEALPHLVIKHQIIVQPCRRKCMSVGLSETFEIVLRSSQILSVGPTKSTSQDVLPVQDFVWSTMAHIRYFLSSEVWNVVLDEYCLHPTLDHPPLLISTAQRQWLGGDNNLRANIFERFLGNFVITSHAADGPSTFALNDVFFDSVPVYLAPDEIREQDYIEQVGVSSLCQQLFIVKRDQLLDYLAKEWLVCAPEEQADIALEVVLDFYRNIGITPDMHVTSIDHDKTGDRRLSMHPELHSRPWLQHQLTCAHMRQILRQVAVRVRRLTSLSSEDEVENSGDTSSMIAVQQNAQPLSVEDRMLHMQQALYDEIQLIKLTTTATHTYVTQIQESSVQQLRGITSLPLLCVISQPAATGLTGRMQRLVQRKYHVCFLCQVCGRVPSVTQSTAIHRSSKKKRTHGDQESEKSSMGYAKYKLVVTNTWALDVLRVLHISLCLLQTALQVAGVQNNLGLLGELARASLETLSDDLQSRLGIDSEDLRSLHRTFQQSTEAQAQASCLLRRVLWTVVRMRYLPLQHRIRSPQSIYARCASSSATSTMLMPLDQV